MLKNISKAFVTLMLIVTTTQVLASKRIALVIGNGDYTINQGKLNNPPRDAASIAKALRKLGFEVILETNIKNREDMEKAE